MDIRRFWATLAERTCSKQRIYADRIWGLPQGAEAITDQGAGALDLQRYVADDGQREEISGKLSVLRAQRAKGVSVLREFRAERRIETPSARGAFRGVANITHEIAVSGARPVGLHAPWAASRQSESGVASPVK